MGKRDRRVLICTVVALASGFVGGLVGGQINVAVQVQRCQTQPWGLRSICKVWVTPGATWQGSITGLWIGSILGAAIAGLATSKIHSTSSPSFHPTEASELPTLPTAELQLAPEQREALHCFMMLLAIAPTAEAITTLHSSLSLEAHQSLEGNHLNQLLSNSEVLQEARQTLLAAGFSAQAVEQAWQMLQAHLHQSCNSSRSNS